MQTTNNFVPTIIEYSAHKAKRYVCCGQRTIAYYKKASHRSYRRMMNTHLYLIAKGTIDYDDYDDSPGHCRCTAWDIW